MNKNKESFKPMIDWLSYRSYEKNRLKAPHIAYYRWRKIYPNAFQFEEIFEKNFENIMKGK